MMTIQPLGQPVPIVFVICEGIQELVGGAINVLAIYDRLTLPELYRPADDDPLEVRVATLWTGGHGRFEQILRPVGEDGQQLHEVRTPFELANTPARHLIVLDMPIPEDPGVLSLVVGRGELDLLRQDLRIERRGQPPVAR